MSLLSGGVCVLQLRCMRCVHAQVFELSRHLKQFGLDNKENVPWDGGRANPAVLEVIRNLVHDIHIITHEAHKMEGVYPCCCTRLLGSLWCFCPCCGLPASSRLSHTFG